MTGTLTILIILLFTTLFILAIGFFFLWQRNIELEEERQNDKKAFEALVEVAKEQSRIIAKQIVKINFLSETHNN